MFDHVGIWVTDREASERFYRTVLSALGTEPTSSGPEYIEWDDFALGADDVHPVTTGLHIGFAAPSREHVDAFWRAGVDAGFRDDGAPGPRPEYSADYYGGFLLDPDGNSAEAVHHGTTDEGANVDHLWIRVADLAAASAFYETIAPHTGFALKSELTDRTQFARGRTASFSVVAGDTPTRNVHLAFPATGNAAVEAFHRTAIVAGYRDNGAPGERPEYHPGYFGAYVLDPDGNNVEVVNHNR